MGEVAHQIVPGGTSSCAERLQKIKILVGQVMAERGVTARKMYRDGIISKRHSVKFIEKLEDGVIPTSEFFAVVDYLKIDMCQAMLVAECLTEPTAYFDPVSQTAKDVAQATIVNLYEKSQACVGSFEPVREAIVNNVGAKTADALIAHHNDCEAKRTEDDVFGRAFR
jgi:hypothetical protein